MPMPRIPRLALRRPLLAISSGAVMLAVALCASPPASASVISVAPGAATGSSAGCSLLDAVRAANASSDATAGNVVVGACTPVGSPGGGGLGYPHGNVIVLSPGDYVFNSPDNFWYGPNALPPIATNIVIIGNLVGTTIERSQQPLTPAFRLFYIGGGESLSGYNAPNITSGKLPGPGQLTLKNVTLRYGLVKGGESSFGGGGMGAGGAIYNQGTLALDGVTISDNEVSGGSSADTNAGNGGGGLGGNAPDSGGNGGGFTGALWPSGANAPAGSFGNGGQGGSNGAPNANGTNGGMGATGGGGGAGGHGGSGTTLGGNGGNGGFGGGGGSGGIGGGGTNNGTGGHGGFGGGGGGGFGSGAGGFGGGDGVQSDSGGGGAAFGGAVFNDGGTLMAVNTTFANNGVSGGDSSFGDGGSGYGGAIFNLNGTVTLRCSTLADNYIHGGSNPNSSGSVAPSAGGAVYNLYYPNPGSPGSDASNGATMTVNSSILSGTTDGGTVNVSALSDCENNAGLFTGGFDVVETPGNCSFGNNDQTASPQLQTTTVSANGGPTPTLALESTSPAINSGDTGTLLGPVPTRDQRGFPRDNEPDAGAYEYGASAIEVTPNALGFGTQTVGAKTHTKGVTITNIATESVTVTSVRFSKTNTLAFSLATDNCTGKSLAPGSGCALEFRFEPFAPGEATAAVAMATDQHTNATLTLHGIGASPVRQGGGRFDIWVLLVLLLLLAPVSVSRTRSRET